MEDNKELIEKIVKIEWDMFQNVNDGGPKASCQSKPNTFYIMRISQCMSWSGETLKSYLSDLTEAQINGRNLLTEKYARMMESTHPEEYQTQIVHMLPALEPEALQLIDEIAKIVLKWEEEVWAKYPNVAERGRPIYREEDNSYVTSLETYLRGELATYSTNTLKLYHENILRQNSENINGSEIILDYTVKQYGFSSLQEANAKL